MALHDHDDIKELKAIQGVEVFATGRWSPMTGGTMLVDLRDLDDAAESFTDLNTVGGFQPVLKLGHSENQEFFGNEQGAPALGFVTALYRQGDKLLADFGRIPLALFDLIKNRRYNQVSVEMHPEIEFQDRKFRNVITAVALLGAEMPAVKGLADLAEALMADGSQTLSFATDQDTVILTKEDEPVTDTNEQSAALIERIAKATMTEVEAKFASQITGLNGSIETLTAERDAAVVRADEAASEVAKVISERDGATSALRDFEIGKRGIAIEAMVDGAITDGKVLPAKRDQTIALAHSMTGTVKYGDAGEEKSGDPLESFADFLGGLNKQVELDVVSSDGDNGVRPGEDSKFANPTEEVNGLVQARMAKDSTNYGKAFAAVMSEIPADLKDRYLKMGDA